MFSRRGGHMKRLSLALFSLVLTLGTTQSAYGETCSLKDMGKPQIFIEKTPEQAYEVLDVLVNDNNNVCDALQALQKKALKLGADAIVFRMLGERTFVAEAVKFR
jgi:hypothetical protein